MSEEVPESNEVVLDPNAPDPLQDCYRDLLVRVESVPEVAMQAAAIGDCLDRLDGEEAVWVLDQLLRGALWGHAGAAEAVLALAWYLIQMRLDDDYDRIRDLYGSAYDAGREAVRDLLREVPPHRSLPKGRGLPEVRLPQDRDVTVGERRTLASGPKVQILERLLMDPNPLVIRKLLSNPQIRLEDVMVLVTRRPTTPELIHEVVRHPRWFARLKAREGAVRNPYGETGTSLRLLPTLGIKLLRAIAFSRDLHPVLHESAKRLVLLREERTAPWRV